jgi:transposase
MSGRRLVSMLHAGLDMHKRFSVVTVIDEDGEPVVAGKRLANNDEEIKGFFEQFKDDVQVVLEAGANWYWICDLLDDLGLDNKLCHPLKTKAIASAKIKTDKIDSSILSQLSRMNFVPEAYKPDVETRHLRELLRYRASLVSMRTSIKNRVHALLTRLNVEHPFTDLFGKSGLEYLRNLELAPVYRNALDGYLEVMESLNEEIKTADTTVRKRCRSCPEVALLQTMPGIGYTISLTILSEIGDINRFHSAKHLASFSGLVPSTSQSGNNLRHGRITRQGSVWLRWALVEAAVKGAMKPGPLRDFYLRLRKKKGNGVARVAVARKMCLYIYYMLKENKDFNEVVRYLKSDLG